MIAVEPRQARHEVNPLKTLNLILSLSKDVDRVSRFSSGQPDLGRPLHFMGSLLAEKTADEAMAQSPEPGLSEKYFSYFPVSPSYFLGVLA